MGFAQDLLKLTITYSLPEEIYMAVYPTQIQTDAALHKHIQSRQDFVIKLNCCAIEQSHINSVPLSINRLEA